MSIMLGEPGKEGCRGRKLRVSHPQLQAQRKVSELEAVIGFGILQNTHSAGLSPAGVNFLKILQRESLT